MRALAVLGLVVSLTAACSDGAAPSGRATPSASASSLAVHASAAPSSGVPSEASAAPSSSATAAPHVSASAPPERDAELVRAVGPRLAVAWHPKGGALLVARGKTLYEITIAGAKKTSLELPAPIAAIDYAYGGARLAVADQTRSLRVLESGTLVTVAEWIEPVPVKPELGATDVHALAFSPDGALVAMSAQRPDEAMPTVAIFDVAARKRRCTSERFAFDLAFTASGASLVATGIGAMARLDPASCEEQASGSAATGGTFGSWVAPLGAHVAAADAAGHDLALFDSRSFARIGVLARSAGCSDHIGPVRFSRDGQILLATGSGRWLRSFRVASMRSIGAYDVPNPDDATLLPFDDGERLLVVRGEQAELVSVVSKTVAYSFETKGASLYSHSWDMKKLAGLSEAALQIWDTATGALVTTVPLAP